MNERIERMLQSQKDKRRAAKTKEKKKMKEWREVTIAKIG